MDLTHNIQDAVLKITLLCGLQETKNKIYNTFNSHRNATKVAFITWVAVHITEEVQQTYCNKMRNSHGL